jgi:tetratricopeptide (TPR) repeat protein
VLPACCFAYSYSKTLEPAVTAMLQENYYKALDECYRLEHTANGQVKTEIFYAEGVCLLSLGEYSRARDVFKKAADAAQGTLATEVYMGIADSHFLEGAYDNAITVYDQLLTKASGDDYLAMLYFKMGKAYQKKSEWAQSDYYFNRLKQKFPKSIEVKLVNETQAGGNFFTIQVGCFTRKPNAQRMLDDLKTKGYEAYLTLFESNGQMLYRVRVGEYVSRLAAEYTENLLRTKENLPTHLFP